MMGTRNHDYSPGPCTTHYLLCVMIQSLVVPNRWHDIVLFQMHELALVSQVNVWSLYQAFTRNRNKDFHDRK